MNVTCTLTQFVVVGFKILVPFR